MGYIMKKCYDFSKGFRKPLLAQQLRENGYTIRVTNDDGNKEQIIDEYYISPEEVESINNTPIYENIQRVGSDL